MIKKVIFCLVLAISVTAFADFREVGQIDPAVSSSEVTISAAGSGKVNCLTNLTVVSDAAYVVRILDGGTTTYQLSLAANSGLAQDWNPKSPFCGSLNKSMTIKVSAGTYTINYSGVIGSK